MINVAYEKGQFYPVREIKHSMENTEKVATVTRVQSEEGCDHRGSAVPSSRVKVAVATEHLRVVTQRNGNLRRCLILVYCLKFQWIYQTNRPHSTRWSGEKREWWGVIRNKETG